MSDSIFNQIKQPDIHFYGNPEISFLHKKKEKRYLHSSQRYIPISKYELTESGDITFCVSDNLDNKDHMIQHMYLTNDAGMNLSDIDKITVDIKTGKKTHITYSMYPEYYDIHNSNHMTNSYFMDSLIAIPFPIYLIPDHEIYVTVTASQSYKLYVSTLEVWDSEYTLSPRSLEYICIINNRIKSIYTLEEPLITIPMNNFRRITDITYYIRDVETKQKLDIVDQTIIHLGNCQRVYDNITTKELNQYSLLSSLPPNNHYISYGIHTSDHRDLEFKSYPYSYDQPSGHGSMDKIDIKLKYIPTKPVELVIFYHYYNVIRFMSKLCGFAYSEGPPPP